MVWRCSPAARAARRNAVASAGSIGRADRIETGADLSYSENTVGTFRRWSVAGEFDTAWNFDGDQLFTRYEARWELGLLNFWRFGGEFDIRPAGLSDTQTRGGPVMGTAGEKAFSLNINSPFQNRLGVNSSLYHEDDDLDGSFTRIRLNFQFRPGGSWQFAAGPSYSHGVNTRQYVTTESGGRPETFGNRYIFATLDRHTISAQFRVNYAFSADLSLEGYFEPFASTGTYSDYGELMTPRESDLLFYGTGGTTVTESTGDAPRTITVQDGTDQFSFARGDFRALSFRSNLVMRWEWLPGSTLFLVWQLDRGGFEFENGPDSAGFGDLLDTPGEPGRNFFAVKASYWLPI